MRAGPRPTEPRSGESCVCERGPTPPMLGGAVVRMTRPWPRRQDEQEARVARRANLVALLGDPVRHGSDAGSPALPALGQLDLTVDDDQIRVLMDLVLLQLLAGGQVDRDRARCSVVGAQDLRLVRLKVER